MPSLGCQWRHTTSAVTIAISDTYRSPVDELHAMASRLLEEELLCEVDKGALTRKDLCN